MTAANDRLAVIDIGTNTFHLLLVERTEGGQGWREIFRERRFVNLAENGIRMISDDAIQRAMAAISDFSEAINAHGASEVRAVGTAAMREAGNSKYLRTRIREEYHIDIEVVSGEKEAQLIAMGVKQALPDQLQNALIVDIGGGSVECIIDTPGSKPFFRSYPIGVAVTYDHFHKSDPISGSEIRLLRAHLEHTLSDLIDEAGKYHSLEMVGASGSFEVIYSALNKRHLTAPYAHYSRDSFQTLCDRVKSMALGQRLADPYIPESRARYIVVAMIIIEFLMERLELDAAGISLFAMKEGIVAEWLEDLA